MTDDESHKQAIRLGHILKAGKQLLLFIDDLLNSTPAEAEYLLLYSSSVLQKEEAK